MKPMSQQTNGMNRFYYNKNTFIDEFRAVVPAMCDDLKTTKLDYCCKAGDPRTLHVGVCAGEVWEKGMRVYPTGSREVVPAKACGPECMNVCPR